MTETQAVDVAEPRARREAAWLAVCREVWRRNLEDDLGNELREELHKEVWNEMVDQMNAEEAKLRAELEPKLRAELRPKVRAWLALEMRNPRDPAFRTVLV